VRTAHSRVLALTAITGLYLALGTVHLTATPTYEKPDEEWHSAYVFYLLENGRLPPLVIDGDLNPAYQIAGHPPLFYATGALVVRALGATAQRPALTPNPFWAYPAPGDVHDNKNRFLHASDEPGRSEFRSIYLLRAYSLILGAGAVVAAYGIARALTGSVRLAMLSAGLVAVLPQYTFITSAVSNDGLVASLAGLGVWLLVHAARRRTDWRAWAAFGTVAGLAALTKTSALTLPILGAVTAVVVGAQSRSARVAILGCGASLGLWLVLCGWWYARNALGYGDPLGLAVHVAQFGQPATTVPWRLLDQWQRTSVTFWAAFGWTNVQYPPAAYLPPRLIEVAAAAGLVWLAASWPVWRAGAKPTPTASKAGNGLADARPNRHPPGRGLAWAIAAGQVALVGATFVWWTGTVTGTLGRLLFPALAPLVAILAAGLNRIWTRLPLAAWAYLAGLALLAPIYIVPAYRAPTLAQADDFPADANRVDVTFADVAQLSTGQAAPRRVWPGESVVVTLCWVPLRQTEHEYAEFIQVLGVDSDKIGERNTYPGLGRYPTSLWQPGRPICDRVDTPIQNSAKGPAVYSVAVGLFDPQSGERLPAVGPDGSIVDFLVIDRVKVNGPSAESLPTSVARLDKSFAGLISLVGYELGPPENSPRSLRLTLYWRAQAAVAADYTVFVHLLNSAGEVAAQADSPPQAGTYQTSWWDAGETVADPHSLVLPSDLPQGRYRVRVGLYLPESSERLLLVDTQSDEVELAALDLHP